MNGNRNKFEFDEHLFEMQKQVLEDKRSFLCKTIQPARHFPYLRQERVLSLEAQQIIEHEVTNSAKVNKFVDELQMNGGPKAFESFIKSLLKEGTQSHVVRALNMALEEKLSQPTVAAAVKQTQASDRRPIEDEDDLPTDPLLDSPSEPHGPMPGPPSLPPLQLLKNLRPQGPVAQEDECEKHELLPHGDVKK